MSVYKTKVQKLSIIIVFMHLWELIAQQLEIVKQENTFSFSYQVNY